MKKLAICLLAYGDHHIDECNFLLKNLKKYKDQVEFYVATDKPNNILKFVDNIIKINGIFNYNLKRIPIKEAFKKYNKILFLDTDNYIINNNINFDVINNVDDGFYVDYKHYYRFRNGYKDVTLKKMEKQLANPKSPKVSKEYFEKLYELNDTGQEYYFIHERIFLIKLSDKNKKNNFISNWDILFEKTKNAQPINKNRGILEGFLIYLSCLKSDINVFFDINEDVNKLFYHFYHYKEDEKNKIFGRNIQTII